MSEIPIENPEQGRKVSDEDIHYYLRGRQSQTAVRAATARRLGHKAEVSRLHNEAVALQIAELHVAAPVGVPDELSPGVREELAPHILTEYKRLAEVGKAHPEWRDGLAAVERVWREVEDILHDPTPETHARFEDTVAQEKAFKKAEEIADDPRRLQRAGGAVIKVDGRYFVPPARRAA